MLVKIFLTLKLNFIINIINNIYFYIFYTYKLIFYNFIIKHCSDKLNLIDNLLKKSDSKSEKLTNYNLLAELAIKLIYNIYKNIKIIFIKN